MPEDLAKAEILLSEAIRLELELQRTDELSSLIPPETSVNLAASCTSNVRLRQLRMFRGDVLGSGALGRYQDSVADFDSVIRDDPTDPRAYLEKAKVLRRARRPVEALAVFKEALGSSSSQ